MVVQFATLLRRIFIIPFFLRKPEVNSSEMSKRMGKGEVYFLSFFMEGSRSPRPSLSRASFLGIPLSSQPRVSK
jgi:hypothetical protein